MRRLALLFLALCVAAGVSSASAQTIVGPSSLPTPSGTLAPTDIVVGAHGSTVVQMPLSALGAGLSGVPLSALAGTTFPGTQAYVMNGGLNLMNVGLAVEGMQIGATSTASGFVPASSTQPICFSNAGITNFNLCISDVGNVTVQRGSVQATAFENSSSYFFPYDAGASGAATEHIERGTVTPGTSLTHPAFVVPFASTPTCFAVSMNSAVALMYSNVATNSFNVTTTVGNPYSYFCIGS